MTNEIKLPPLQEPTKQLNFAEYFMGLALYCPEQMRDYATQAILKDRAQRDADHLAELRAYELTVANLREQLAQPETVERLLCDFCGCETPDPWHGSTETDRHIHACDACKPKLWAPQAPQVPMTEAAAEDLATTSWILNCLLNPWDELNNGDEQSSVLPDMVRLIRAVEAFHGIKEQP